MSEGKGVSRRTVVKGAVAGAAVGLAGFPFIGRAQADAIRIGHLTPRTGFLHAPTPVCVCRMPAAAGTPS